MSGWTFDMLEALGYLGLVLVLIAEHLFPPIPSEAILPLAGFLVGQGTAQLREAAPGLRDRHDLLVAGRYRGGLQRGWVKPTRQTI